MESPKIMKDIENANKFKGYAEKMLQKHPEYMDEQPGIPKEDEDNIRNIISLYSQAVNKYKGCERLVDAAECLLKAATLSTKLEYGHHEAALKFIASSELFGKVDDNNQNVIDILYKAAYCYEKAGRNANAAKVFVQIGQIQEVYTTGIGMDIKRAIEAYEKASHLYDLELSRCTSMTYLEKATILCISIQRWEQALYNLSILYKYYNERGDNVTAKCQLLDEHVITCRRGIVKELSEQQPIIINNMIYVSLKLKGIPYSLDHHEYPQVIGLKNSLSIFFECHSKDTLIINHIRGCDDDHNTGIDIMIHINTLITWLNHEQGCPTIKWLSNMDVDVLVGLSLNYRVVYLDKVDDILQVLNVWFSKRDSL